MEQAEPNKLAQTLGIILLAVMAFSMLAGALLYVDRPSTNTTNQDPQTDIPIPTDTQFTYNIDLNTTAIKDLDSARIGLMTTNLNKAEIDLGVQKISGVSKVSSQFKKNSPDANNWLYLADLTLKKNTDLMTILTQIIDLNYFDKTQGYDAMKYMTISAPQWTIIHNTDLNIDRNFAFTQTTFMALTRISTNPSDEIEVEGQISVQGKAMLAINLYEKQNYTKERQLQQLDLNYQIDTNKSIDTNTSVGTNTPTDTNTPKT
jgi:hypothetical protein